jgi:hypothetical protein
MRDDNVKIDFQEVGWGRGAWIKLIWLRIRTDEGHL